jgi:hypothetical protein
MYVEIAIDHGAKHAAGIFYSEEMGSNEAN